MSEPTPRPWERSGPEILSDDRHVATCWNNDAITPDESEANADLIVRAVNAHDALVEACEAVIDREVGLGKETLDALHNALALAKEPT